jgi:hypothetical protein
MATLLIIKKVGGGIAMHSGVAARDGARSVYRDSRAVEVVLAAKGAAGFGQLTENSKSAPCFRKYLLMAGKHYGEAPIYNGPYVD